MNRWEKFWHNCDAEECNPDKFDVLERYRTTEINSFVEKRKCKKCGKESAVYISINGVVEISLHWFNLTIKRNYNENNKTTNK